MHSHVDKHESKYDYKIVKHIKFQFLQMFHAIAVHYTLNLTIGKLLLALQAY